MAASNPRWDAVAAAAAITAVSGAAMLGAVSRSGFDGSIEPAAAAAAYDLFGNLLGVALPAIVALLIATTTLAARRSGWFTGWATTVSWVLTVGLLATPVAWIFLSAAALWLVAVGISMARRDARHSRPTLRGRTA